MEIENDYHRKFEKISLLKIATFISIYSSSVYENMEWTFLNGLFVLVMHAVGAMGTWEEREREKQRWKENWRDEYSGDMIEEIGAEQNGMTEYLRWHSTHETNRFLYILWFRLRILSLLLILLHRYALPCRIGKCLSHILCVTEICNAMHIIIIMNEYIIIE